MLHRRLCFFPSFLSSCWVLTIFFWRLFYEMKTHFGRKITSFHQTMTIISCLQFLMNIEMSKTHKNSDAKNKSKEKWDRFFYINLRLLKEWISTFFHISNASFPFIYDDKISAVLEIHRLKFFGGKKHLWSSFICVILPLKVEFLLFSHSFFCSVIDDSISRYKKNSLFMPFQLLFIVF